MMLDDVIEIKKANPDSQYLLLPCKKCGSDNVAYVHYEASLAHPYSASASLWVIAPQSRSSPECSSSA